MQLGFRQVVPPTIDLDHQTRAMMDEVEDIASHRGLAPDVEVEAAERFPEDALTGGHFTA
ncbi:hypothetical protein ASD79_15460 [Caulobacter sp. Root655]|nr:hypothetical protein ASD79_15460 [Caulobacter sp. Root655]